MSNENETNTGAPTVENETSKAPKAPRVKKAPRKAPELKRHVIIVNDKKGAEAYSCGAAPTMRTARINAILLEARRPLATSEVIAMLDALYGANVVKCVRNHLSTLLTKGAVTFTDKKWALKKKAPSKAQKSDAPATETTDESK